MRRGRPISLARAACLLPLLVCSTALADGKYFPERAVEKPVAIPSQRAVVRFRECRETLIVESAAESDSKSLGWVIPLPAEPDRVEVVRPGLFESLAVCLGARITHDLWLAFSAAGLVFSLVLLVSLVLALGWIWARALTYASILVLSVMVFTPLALTAGSRGVGEASGITVASAKRVGSYETTILRTDSPEALDEWLASNGFAGLDDANGEERRIISDYIAKGWCFFAAKLVREESGAATPHPVLLEFATSDAVYPLRLTVFAGSRTTLDIYAVGEREAVFPGLHTALADSFRWSGDGSSPYDRLWEAETVGARIGHPDLARLFWNGCVVTRFTDSLSFDGMRDDVILGWKGLRTRRDRKYSVLGAAYTGVLVSFALGAAGMIAALFARRRDFGEGGSRRRALVALAVPLGASAVVGLACFIAASKVAATTSTWRHPRTADMNRQMAMLLHMREAFADGSPATLTAARDALRAGLARDDILAGGALQRNPHSGGETLIEASPGNFDVRKDDGAVRVEYYDRFARAVTVGEGRAGERPAVEP